jgi:hypothetical protein
MLYILVSFGMLGPTREINCYLISMWHLPLFFCRWFGKGLECQVVASEVYSWFPYFNISITIPLYDLKLVVHLVLFDFEVKFSWCEINYIGFI